VRIGARTLMGPGVQIYTASHPMSPEERAKIEAALPAKAPATPRRPRKLLVFDRQGIYNGKQYGGHGSIPHANLAVQLMGEKTGAFTATLSSEPGTISAANLQQFDAVYLNNTVGDVFDTPEMRAAFVAFVTNGGGIVGNHGASVASPQWTEFGEILGATGAVGTRSISSRVGGFTWAYAVAAKAEIESSSKARQADRAEEIIRGAPLRVRINPAHPLPLPGGCGTPLICRPFYPIPTIIGMRDRRLPG